MTQQVSFRDKGRMYFLINKLKKIYYFSFLDASSKEIIND